MQTKKPFRLACLHKALTYLLLTKQQTLSYARYFCSGKTKMATARYILNMYGKSLLGLSFRGNGLR